MKALVSIIIPIYNVSKYMDECIRSACDQDYENLEIILVDDGSTDESRKICDEYANQYSLSVSVIHKRNEGPLLARIEGIRRAQGKYLLF